MTTREVCITSFLAPVSEGVILTQPKKMKLMKAIENVLEEDARTREPRYNWLFFVKVLREMGFKIFIKFDYKMPSPETLFRERREILNKRNKYPKSFEPEENVTIEKPKQWEKKHQRKV